MKSKAVEELLWRQSIEYNASFVTLGLNILAVAAKEIPSTKKDVNIV